MILLILLEEHSEIAEADRQDIFLIKVEKSHDKPLYRQIAEATTIMRRKREGKVNVLNDRDEYNRCLIPVLQVSNPINKAQDTPEIPDNVLEECIRERSERKRQAELEKKDRRAKRERLSSLREFFFKSDDQKKQTPTQLEPHDKEISSAKLRLKPRKRLTEQNRRDRVDTKINWDQMIKEETKEEIYLRDWEKILEIREHKKRRITWKHMKRERLRVNENDRNTDAEVLEPVWYLGRGQGSQTYMILSAIDTPSLGRLSAPKSNVFHPKIKRNPKLTKKPPEDTKIQPQRKGKTKFKLKGKNLPKSQGMDIRKYLGSCSKFTTNNSAKTSQEKV